MSDCRCGCVSNQCVIIQMAVPIFYAPEHVTSTASAKSLEKMAEMYSEHVPPPVKAAITGAIGEYVADAVSGFVTRHTLSHSGRTTPYQAHSRARFHGRVSRQFTRRLFRPSYRRPYRRSYRRAYRRRTSGYSAPKWRRYSKRRWGVRRHKSTRRRRRKGRIGHFYKKPLASLKPSFWRKYRFDRNGNYHLR